MPFHDPDHLPDEPEFGPLWWTEADIPEPELDEPEVLPEWDPSMGNPLHIADQLDVVPPCGCACCQEPVCRPTDFGRAPDSLAERAEAEWRAMQSATARFWRAAAAMHSTVQRDLGSDAAEFVGDDLALITNTHPRTGQTLMSTSVYAAHDVPELAGLVENGHLSSKHVDALLDEVGRFTGSRAQAAAVIRLTLERCRGRAAREGWPSPGDLRKRLRTAAVLSDLEAHQKRKKTIAERRGVGLHQTQVGAAMLVIEGPELMVAQMHDAIHARAEAMGQLEGDTRSLHERMFDAADELLMIDADGGPSLRPAVGEGQLVQITVRGVQVAVVIPYSVALGGNHEVAEIAGLGPVLPSTARELLNQADTIRRVAVDADTGEVLTVDDAQPGPARLRQREQRRAAAKAKRGAHREAQREAQRGAPLDADRAHDSEPHGNHDGDHDDRGEPEDDEPEDDGPTGGGGTEPDRPPAPRSPAPGAKDPLPAVPVSSDLSDGVCGYLCHPEEPDPDAPAPPEAPVDPEVLTLIQRVAGRMLVWFDLHSSHYRVPGRLRRHVEHRDRTCCFPGCTVPGRYCDVDHREEWPRGGTHDGNCHCLCRRHHRAKQAYFTVALDGRGTTLWTTPDARTYRRPPPRY